MDIEKEAKVNDTSLVHLHRPNIKTKTFSFIKLHSPAVSAALFDHGASASRNLTLLALMQQPYFITLLYLQVIKKLLFQFLPR